MKATAWVCALLGAFVVSGQLYAGQNHRYNKPVPSLGERVGQLLNRDSGFDQSVAIILGVSDYGGDWESITTARADPLRMRKFLIDAGFDIVVILTDDEVTKENVERYMEDVFPELLGPKDRFLFYYSGHGTQRKLRNGRVRGYLPLSSSERGKWSSMISMDDLSDWHRNFESAKHVLFIIDACFSGLAGVQSKSDDGLDRLTYLDLSQRGHHLFTAGTEDQVSLSADIWGGSLFTKALIDGARGAADTATTNFQKDGLVSLTELRLYIRERVNAERRRYPHLAIKQTAQWSDLLGASEGEFFFVAEDLRVERSTPSVSTPGSFQRKGEAVLQRAVEAMGGVEAIDEADVLMTFGLGVQPTAQGDLVEIPMEILHVSPDRTWQRMQLPSGEMTIVVDGDLGSVTDAQGTREIPTAQVAELKRSARRSPLSILRSRSNEGFNATFLGVREIGGQTLEHVQVELDGEKIVLVISLDGHIVQVIYQSTGPDGKLGEVVGLYSDFRAVGNLIYPFSMVSTFDSERKLTYLLYRVEVNPEMNEDFLKTLQ